MAPPLAQPAPFNRHLARAVIGGLLIAFAALAYFAVASKSPTFDEPLHALGAWQHLHTGDFRVNPEDPPLWHYWAALPNGADAIHANTHSPLFDRVAYDTNMQWDYVVHTLYDTPGNDADAFIMRSRVMMLIVGVALGVSIAWWTWQLAGPFAAVVASLFFCLDPNFLGHAPLVKNDVSLTFVTLCLAWSIWRAGLRMTWANALAVCVCCAAAVNVKFSGLVLGPIAAILLISRALLGQQWTCLGRNLGARSRKLVAAVGLCVAAAVISYVGTWAVYQFRYNSTPDPAVPINLDALMRYTAYSDLKLKLHRWPTTQEAIDWQPGFTPRTIMWLDSHRLLPQAWLAGLLYTYQSALTRPSYLMGDYSITGWWYYFPMAMLYKSPLTLLVAGAIGAAVWIYALRHRAPVSALAQPSMSRWTLICLAIPPIVFLASAMASNLNLGLRHVLVVYPFAYIGLGIAAGSVHVRAPRLAQYAVAIFAVALATESLLAFPNYIAFFNVAAGGSRGGIDLLGDSNLDWGQDLKLLVEWRRNHPQGKLYLMYFGKAEPSAYGMTDFVNCMDLKNFGLDSREPGVLAVSATILQGIYVNERYRAMYNTIRKLPPIDVLGGTIYLYHWPPPELPRE